MTFELGWKLVQDSLEDQGFQAVATPRDAIKKAFELGLLDGRPRLEGLGDRNLTAHSYVEVVALKVERLVRERYLPARQ